MNQIKIFFHRHADNFKSAEDLISDEFKNMDVESLITRNEDGSPKLNIANYQISISNTDEVLVVAISDSYHLGIDFEMNNNAKECLAIANRFFSKEEVSLIDQSETEADKINLFLNFWTKKEAATKLHKQDLGDWLSFNFSRNTLEQSFLTKNISLPNIHGQCSIAFKPLVHSDNSFAPDIILQNIN